MESIIDLFVHSLIDSSHIVPVLHFEEQKRVVNTQPMLFTLLFFSGMTHEPKERRQHIQYCRYVCVKELLLVRNYLLYVHYETFLVPF